MSELRECPFCGGEAETAVIERAFYPHSVRCTVCGVAVKGSAFKNDEFNSSTWNTRSEDQRVQELVEALELLFVHVCDKGFNINPFVRDAVESALTRAKG